MIVKTPAEKIFQFLKYLIWPLWSSSCSFQSTPLILAAFRPGRDLMRYGISFSTLIPNVWDGKNFLSLFVDRNGRYLIWFGNSVLLSALQNDFQSRPFVVRGIRLGSLPLQRPQTVC